MPLLTDSNTQTLTIPQITDTLTPTNPNGNPGQTQQLYSDVPITYTYTTPQGDIKTITIPLNLTVKNPCVDQNFVKIES